MKFIKKKNKSSSTSQCGLCGKTTNLTKTPCCDHWICNDVSKSRKNCFHKHEKYTICSYHYHEQHSGTWKECKTCRDAFGNDMFVYFGTNKYNFEKLENPPY